MSAEPRDLGDSAGRGGRGGRGPETRFGGETEGLDRAAAAEGPDDGDWDDGASSAGARREESDEWAEDGDWADEDGGPHGEETSEEEGAKGQARAPWHFKVILVGSVVYLGWRAYQGIGWLAHHIH